MNNESYIASLLTLESISSQNNEAPSHYVDRLSQKILSDSEFLDEEIVRLGLTPLLDHRGRVLN